MKRFSKEFKNWTCSDDERISISYIETKGKDLDDFLCNAMVSFEDWHGNCCRDGWTIGDLSQKDYDEVVQLFNEFLGGS